MFWDLMNNGISACQCLNYLLVYKYLEHTQLGQVIKMGECKGVLFCFAGFGTTLC